MLQEFIEELKHGLEINTSDMDGRIDIEYVIERLEDIQKELLEQVEYFDYHNKNLFKKQDEVIQSLKDKLKDKGVFK